MTASAADRRAALALLQETQLVYALSLESKQAVLRRAHDVAALREHVAAMRRAAGELSKRFRDEHGEVPWSSLETDDEPGSLWTLAKRVSPKVLRALTPVVAEAPESAFLLAPPAPGSRRATKPGRRRGPRGTG